MAQLLNTKIDGTLTARGPIIVRNAEDTLDVLRLSNKVNNEVTVEIPKHLEEDGTFKCGLKIGEFDIYSSPFFLANNSLFIGSNPSCNGSPLIIGGGTTNTGPVVYISNNTSPESKEGVGALNVSGGISCNGNLGISGDIFSNGISTSISDSIINLLDNHISIQRFEEKVLDRGATLGLKSINLYSSGFIFIHDERYPANAVVSFSIGHSESVFTYNFLNKSGANDIENICKFEYKSGNVLQIVNTAAEAHSFKITVIVIN